MVLPVDESSEGSASSSDSGAMTPPAKNAPPRGAGMREKSADDSRCGAPNSRSPRAPALNSSAPAAKKRDSASEKLSVSLWRAREGARPSVVSARARRKRGRAALVFNGLK